MYIDIEMNLESSQAFQLPLDLSFDSQNLHIMLAKFYIGHISASIWTLAIRIIRNLKGFVIAYYKL